MGIRRQGVSGRGSRLARERTVHDRRQGRRCRARRPAAADAPHPAGRPLQARGAPGRKSDALLPPDRRQGRAEVQGIGDRRRAGPAAGRGMTTATLTHMPISRLVEMLETMLRAPVVDETGLKGRYDATLNIAQYASSPVQMDDIPSFLAGAVQDLLGLKLEPKKGPVQVVVVVHAEKAPTEN